MMRMLAWVNLLQNDGLVNQALSLGGLLRRQRRLARRAVRRRSILGLVYGYVPYMILPLFAGLDRLPASVLEAARDLGAEPVRDVPAGHLAAEPAGGRRQRAADLPADARRLLHQRPALGLAAAPSMVGNLINNSVLTPGQTGQAGAFVLLVLLVSLLPMLSTSAAPAPTGPARRERAVRARDAGGATRGGRRGCSRRHHRLPGLVAAAGADRGPVLVQRRPVAHGLAGLLDAVVLRRPAAVGLARRHACTRR